MGLTLRALAGRTVAALLLAAAVTGAAVSGNYFTTAPEAISLTFEPLSLLLMPGIFIGMSVANIVGFLHHHPGSPQTTHDYTNKAVILGSFVFYFAFFLYALSRWLPRLRAQTPRQTSG